MTIELIDNVYKAKIIKDSISPDLVRLTTMEITFPRIVLSEFNTHRNFCLSGDTKITIDKPSSLKKGLKSDQPMILKDIVEKWFNGDSDKRDMKFRLKRMNLRSLNEETGEFYNTHIVDCFKSGEKDIFELKLENNYLIKLTREHRIFTNKGWVTLNDINIQNHNGIISWNKNAPEIATNGISIEDIFEEKKNGLTRAEIGRKYNIPNKQLEWICIKNNISFDKKIHTPNETFEYKNKEWLEEKLAQGLFSTQIAKLCNSTYDRIKKMMRKFGLKGNRNPRLGSIPWNKGLTYTFPEEKLVNVRAAAKKRIKPDSHKSYIDFNIKSTRFLSEIRKEIYEKYDYKCQVTGFNQNLELHHIDPVWHNKEKAFDKENIILINKKVHRFIHSNNLDLDFLQWVSERKDITKFIDAFPNVKKKCDDINKPKTPGNKLIVRYSKIVSIKYVGKEQTYDLEVSGPFHNFVGNGIIVHNSRNSASSRAIPVDKIIKRIEENPFIPSYWGKNQSGMQANEELDQNGQVAAKIYWTKARDNALESAKYLRDIGVHKQIANRLLEPFMMHTVLVTATEWANFFALRCHPDAQPEIRKIALMMKDALNQSAPHELGYGNWHMPLVSNEETNEWCRLNDSNYDNIFNKIADCVELFKKVSIGRSARVSYLTHDGKKDIEADIKLYERLKTSGHLSPFEHVARPIDNNDLEEDLTFVNQDECSKKRSNKFIGNFRGWKQARKEITNEHNFGEVKW